MYTSVVLVHTMFYIHFIYAFFFFLDYTYVRIPSNYCNDINSSPKYFIKIYENGSSQLSKNLQYNITLDQQPFVSQDDIFDIVDQTTSSSALDKGKGPLID